MDDSVAIMSGNLTRVRGGKCHSVTGEINQKVFET